MSETIGRLLAAGNVGEVFEWGSRVVKLYRSPARKLTAFREVAIRGSGDGASGAGGVERAGGRRALGIVFDRINERSFADWRTRFPPRGIAMTLAGTVPDSEPAFAELCPGDG